VPNNKASRTNKHRYGLVTQRRHGRVFQQRSASSATPERRVQRQPPRKSGTRRNGQEPRPVVREDPQVTVEPSGGKRPDLLFVAGSLAGPARSRNAPRDSADRGPRSAAAHGMDPDGGPSKSSYPQLHRRERQSTNLDRTDGPGSATGAGAGRLVDTGGSLHIVFRIVQGTRI
jgi:hypothetical protein